jgi:hypothetical protein
MAKALRVIRSCKTKEQLNTACIYAALAMKTMMNSQPEFNFFSASFLLQEEISNRFKAIHHITRI